MFSAAVNSHELFPMLLLKFCLKLLAFSKSTTRQNSYWKTSANDENQHSELNSASFEGNKLNNLQNISEYI